MTPEEKQAVYDEIDRIAREGGDISPELLAKIDVVLKEDAPELAAELGIF